MLIRTLRVFIFFFVYTASIKVNAYDQDLMYQAKTKSYVGGENEVDLQIKEAFRSPIYISFEDYVLSTKRSPASVEDLSNLYFSNQVLHEIPLETTH